VAVAALLVVVVALWFGGSSEPVADSRFAGATFTSITNFQGDEHDATISPDGRFVAFVADGEDVFDVWLSQVDTGNLSNLTLGQVGDVRGPSEVRSVGFHVDGSQIWLGGAPWRRMQFIPLVGGAFRNALGELVVNADWSPDGAHVVYHTREDGDPIYVADADGANSALILGSDAGQHQHYPVWSHDGQWIYLTRGRPATGEMALWRVRPNGDDLEVLTENQLDVRYPTPLDARTVVYVAREENGAGPWLWSLDVGSKASQRTFFGLQQYTSVAASADGQRLVASVADPQASLWSVPILDGLAAEGDAQPFRLPSVRALAPRFGPNGLFYLSSRGTGDGLWRLENGEAVEIRSGAGAPLLAPPAVSPDGTAVTIVPRRDERLTLEIVSADGAETLARIESIDVQGAAAWSPDGQWIVTGGRSAEGNGIFKIPVGGGTPEILALGGGINPVWSPKGDLIVYAGVQVNAFAPILAIRPDGTPVDLPEIQVLRTGQRFRFLPDGEGLVYMQGELASAQDFWLLDLQSLSSRRLTELDSSATMNSFDITPDGATIVFDRLRQNSDIVLIDLAG
jgi:Tol biopolymer transport system component